MTTPAERLALHADDLDASGHDTSATVGDILLVPAAETDTALRLAPDGVGGVEWASAGGGGAPADADYLVGTANGGLSAEIVVGTSPGGELGGSWSSPTVDATHSGSSHAGVQAAAEAAAASDATTKANAAQAAAILAAWPVGSVFLSVVSTSPATLLGGGTWSAFGAGRVLVGLDSGDANFDTAEETGGAKTVASSAQTFAGTLSTTVVNHVHPLATGTGSTGSFAQVIGTVDNSSGGNGGTPTQTALGTLSGNPSGGSANYTPAGTNTPGAATSVVQPYIVVYMWKRTA